MTTSTFQTLSVPADAKVLFLGPDLVEIDDELTRLHESVGAYNRAALPSGPTSDAMMAEFQLVLDRLNYLFRLRRSAGVVPCPFDAEVVDIGTTVTYLPLSNASAVPERVSLGSAIVGERLAAKGFVSYLSDLGLLLRGAVVGDVRRGVVGDEELAVRVLDVQSALALLL